MWNNDGKVIASSFTFNKRPRYSAADMSYLYSKLRKDVAIYLVENILLNKFYTLKVQFECRDIDEYTGEVVAVLSLTPVITNKTVVINELNILDYLPKSVQKPQPQKKWWQFWKGII